MKAIRRLLIVILLLVTTSVPGAEPKPVSGWVFYGLLLKPTSRETPPQWQPNGPNFSILKPGSTLLTLPKRGMIASCLHTMNVRATCLKVELNAAPGAYEWGNPTGEKLNPGDKIGIRAVTKLPSKLGEYFWIEIEPVPAH